MVHMLDQHKPALKFMWVFFSWKSMLRCETFPNFHHSWLWCTNRLAVPTYCLRSYIDQQQQQKHRPLNLWCSTSTVVNQYQRVSGWEHKTSSTSPVKALGNCIDKSKNVMDLFHHWSSSSLIKPAFKNLEWLFSHPAGFKTTGKWIVVLCNDFLQMQFGCYLNKDKWVFMFLWMYQLDRYTVQLLTDIMFTQRLFMSFKYCFILVYKR